MSAVNVVKHINDLQLIGKVKNFTNNQIFEKNKSRTQVLTAMQIIYENKYKITLTVHVTV